MRVIVYDIWRNFGIVRHVFGTLGRILLKQTTTAAKQYFARTLQKSAATTNAKSRATVAITVEIQVQNHNRFIPCLNYAFRFYNILSKHAPYILHFTIRAE